MISLLLAAALCLPPGLPDPSTLHEVGHQLRMIEAVDGGPALVVEGTRYQNAAGANVYDLFSFLGSPALIDDHPDDEADFTWWIDPSMVTDDHPPKAQPTPHPSCQWRRRADQKT